ncbi:MAG TPA: porin family protein [Bacteroidales bacterium]|nr:porin family protein [Bacteroidales bacterium]
MSTRKSILFASALMLVSVSTFAQTTFGLKQGAAMTTLSAKGDLYNDNNNSFSYNAGLFATIPVNTFLAIQPEINYVRKGRCNETTELNTTTKTDFLLHYMQVPVLLQYRNNQLLNKSASVFFINAGPYAGFVLDTQTRVSESSEGGMLVPVEDDKNTDWGAVFGIGVQTPIRGKEVRFDLRYDMGLSEIANQPTDYRTKALSLTVGIIL